MRERFGANRNGLGGCARMSSRWLLTTEQQPLNNIVRVAYQAMAGVLGGCQSLPLIRWMEPLVCPPNRGSSGVENNKSWPMRTRVHRTVDPLGGSWYVEALTDHMEADANEIINEIDNMGGVVSGINKGISAEPLPMLRIDLVKRWTRGTESLWA